MAHFHAGHNVHGYLPESDDTGYVFDTFDDAKRSLIDDILRHADSIAEHDADAADALAAVAEDVNLWTGQDYVCADDDTPLGRVYWIAACHDSECVEARAEMYVNTYR